MIPTAAQLTKLRSRPHNTKLYLSVYNPTTILACRVNDLAIVKGAREITYDGVTAGSYSLIQSGMSMYVGSSLGAFDKGIVRVRSATSSVLTIAENSHINWADNDYLTVVNLYEINAIYPRIIADPADETNTLWYKDYDITYTNQNTILGSFINMGSHFAGFLENGSCNVYYSASGTYNLKAESLSYHWFFEGATVTGSTANTPGNISYNTPGHYTTRLIVSGSTSGAVDVSYRHISIYDKPGSGQETPIEKWELTSFSGSRDQGGYSIKLRIHETVSPTILRDGSLVVIFAEDWYGDLVTKQSIGGNALGRSSIVFVGYVIKGTIQYNYRESWIDFDVGSPSEIMKLAEGFGVSVQDHTDPSTATSNPDIPSAWVTVLNMDIRRAIYHYLRWHSTVLMTNDFEFIGTDRAIQYFDADRTSLYDAINSIMKGAFVGSVVCDRQGKIWAERHIYIEPSLFPTTFELSNNDWIGDISFDDVGTDQVSFIELGGVAYSGSTGTYTAFLANAPGVAPNYRGGTERAQGLALISQTELNDIVGSIYAQRNSQYPDMTVNMMGNYRNFDIAPQEKTPITLASTDTVRGITFSSKNFFPYRMEWKYNPKEEIFLPRISFSELTTGFAGDAVSIPPVPVTESGGFNIPSIEVPQIIIPPFPTINIGGSTYPNFAAPDNYRFPSSSTGFPNKTELWLSSTASFDAAESLTMIIPEDCPYTQLTSIPVFLGNAGGSGNILCGNGIDVVGFDAAQASDDIVVTPQTVLTVQQPDTLASSYPSMSITFNIAYKPCIFVVYFYRIGSSPSDTYDGAIGIMGWLLNWI